MEVLVLPSLLCYSLPDLSVQLGDDSVLAGVHTRPKKCISFLYQSGNVFIFRLLAIWQCGVHAI